MSVYEEIIKKGGCVKCGFCVFICYKNALYTEYNIKTGFYDININKEKCNACRLCIQTCPSMIGINKDRKVIGEYNDILLMKSTNFNVNRFSTSGGFINSMIRYLVLENKLDAILIVREDKDAYNKMNAFVVDKLNVNQLLIEPRAFASRYVNYPLLANLNKLNDKNKIGVVGTPCQITALRKYNQLMKKNIFLIGIACSAGISYKASEILLKKRKMQRGNIYYRGDGWPGISSTYDDFARINENHLDSSFNKMFISQIFKNNACSLNCHDQFAMESDISCFDFWNAEEIKNEKIGNSGIIVRSKLGKDYCEDMILKGYVKQIKKLAENDVVKSQDWVLRLKLGNYYSKPLVKLYFIITRIIFKTGVCKLIPLQGYNYFSLIFRKIIKYYE